MNKNDGGPAFPSQSSMRDDWFGMSIRDYFAAAALQGELARSGTHEEPWTLSTAEQLAQYCYSFADSMLKERAK